MPSKAVKNLHFIWGKIDNKGEALQLYYHNLSTVLLITEFNTDANNSYFYDN